MGKDWNDRGSNRSGSNFTCGGPDGPRRFGIFVYLQSTFTLEGDNKMVQKQIAQKEGDKDCTIYRELKENGELHVVSPVEL